MCVYLSNDSGEILGLTASHDVTHTKIKRGVQAGDESFIGCQLLKFLQIKGLAHKVPLEPCGGAPKHSSDAYLTYVILHNRAKI